MKKLLLCLALPLFLLTMSVPAFAKDKTGKGEKVIENKLYSITLPSDWEPGSLQKKDGTPYERNAGPYHLYIFQWNSPKKESSSMDTASSYKATNDGTERQSQWPIWKKKFNGTTVSPE